MPRQADFHELLAVIFCGCTGAGWRSEMNNRAVRRAANQRGQMSARESAENTKLFSSSFTNTDDKVLSIDNIETS